MNFGNLTNEWYAHWAPQRRGRYAFETKQMIASYVLPNLSSKDIHAIQPTDILAICRPVEAKGKYETAHKILGHVNKIFRYAIACGYTLTNPGRDLAPALQPRQTRHMASIFEKEKIGDLMLNIDRYNFRQRRNALRLLAHTFVRAGELVSMRWEDIDWEDKTWNIPAERMKMKRPHSVPLTPQSIKILKEQMELSGGSEWVFPSRWNKSRHENPNALTLGLRHIGYAKNELCAHGFRAMAATTLSEMDWDSQLIERELAHIDSNATRAAYQRSDLLKKRRVMMAAWSDWLDTQHAKAWFRYRDSLPKRRVRQATESYQPSTAHRPERAGRAEPDGKSSTRPPSLRRAERQAAPSSHRRRACRRASSEAARTAPPWSAQAVPWTSQPGTAPLRE